MKNILFIAASILIFSCSKNDNPTPEKEGTFSINYKVAMVHNVTSTEVGLSFGHYENNGNSMVYTGHRTITITGAANVNFSFDTLVKADFVKFSLGSPSLRDNAAVILKYNSGELFNQTVTYSQISPGYTQEIKF